MSDLNKDTLKPRAEHMSKVELVQEFRKLQGWYNAMKIAVDDLESKYSELQQKYQDSVNLNLTMQARVKNQETLLLNEITSNNEKKQDSYKEITMLKETIHFLKKQVVQPWQ